MSDPVIRRVRRSIDEARNRGGMQAGMPKVTIDSADAERLCEAAAILYQRVTDCEGAIERREQLIAEANSERDSAMDAEVVAWAEVDRLQAECEKLRKDAETEQAIQRAAEVLPPGYRIEIEVEKDAGSVALFAPGATVECDFQGGIAEQIADAIDAARQEPSHDQ